MSFKPKPTGAARLSGAELAQAVEQSLPAVPHAVVVSTPPSAAAPGPQMRGGKGAKPSADYSTVQVNFRCTTEFADLLADDAEQQGISIRQLIARWGKANGRPVPQFDLTPPTPTRREKKHRVAGQRAQS
jgi:hypothetical protein